MSGGHVYFDTSILHGEARGIREKKLNAGPASYANELARYIRCPSTVRARTVDHYGRGPSLAEIRAMRQRHEERDARYREAWSKLGHSDNDALFKPDAPERIAEIFEPLPIADPNLVLPEQIIAAVEKAYKLDPGDILGRSRRGEIVRARQAAAYIFRHRGNSTPKVGALLGGRDHSTVLHAIARFEAMASTREREFAARMIGGGQ